MFRQQNGLVDPMEVPINRSVLGDKKNRHLKYKKKKKKIKKIKIKKRHDVVENLVNTLVFSSLCHVNDPQRTQ